MTKNFELHSGERISATDEGLAFPDHIARYRYVAQDLKGHPDIRCGADIFCGSGYGANILATEIDASILAIDGSEETIAQASKRFRRSNLFFSAKLFPFRLPENTFDFIASMESAEHVLDSVAFCRILCRSIRTGGRLYISAPNEKKLVLERLKYPWHYRHFHGRELIQIIESMGMQKLRGFSTSLSLNREGDHVCFYPYQYFGDALMPEEVGDTHFFTFEKST